MIYTGIYIYEKKYIKDKPTIDKTKDMHVL